MIRKNNVHGYVRIAFMAMKNQCMSNKNRNDFGLDYSILHDYNGRDWINFLISVFSEETDLQSFMLFGALFQALMPSLMNVDEVVQLPPSVYLLELRVT